MESLTAVLSRALSEPARVENEKRLAFIPIDAEQVHAWGRIDYAEAKRELGCRERGESYVRPVRRKVPPDAPVLCAQTCPEAAGAPLDHAFGERLFLARRSLGLSIKAVTAQFRIGAVRFGRWEAGRKPGADLIPELAALLGVSTAWLTTGTGTPPQQPTIILHGPCTNCRSRFASRFYRLASGRILCVGCLPTRRVRRKEQEI